MKLKLAWTAVTLTGLAFGIGWCFLPDDPISQATCDSLKKGMTEAEVIDVVGREWDASGSNWCHVMGAGGFEGKTAKWNGPGGSIHVAFRSELGDEQRVSWMHFFPSDTPLHQRILSTVRKRLRW
jgi:hypothetical protein